MKTRDNAYRAAEEAARIELTELNAKLVEMEPIIRRKAMIEVFLQNANALAEPASDVVGNAISVRVADSVRVSDSARAVIVPGKGKNLWEGAREVLADAKHPMTAPWIVKAMQARGWQFKAKWKIEIVRGAMQRKPDVFEAVGKGFYALTEWPREMKKVSRDLATKARHGIDLAATIQSAPDKEDFKGTIFEKK